MKKIALLLLLIPQAIFAQIWYFGNSAGLNFNNMPPTIAAGSAINTGEGCAMAFNQTKALLFYTDGTTIWRKDHTPMPTSNNTTATLMGNSSATQSAIIIPIPNEVVSDF
ncbi:MAG: hypothetical protein IPJ74_17365 [Saprospiraceae bacterium]|nr:hypothetical protein [Saprospiraceae bacterium]